MALSCFPCLPSPLDSIPSNADLAAQRGAPIPSAAPSWISRHARTSIQIDATSPISSAPPPTIRHRTQIVVEDSLPVVDDFIAAISDFFALDLRHWAPSTGIQIAVCSLRSGMFMLNSQIHVYLLFLLFVAVCSNHFFLGNGFTNCSS
uniref:Uncharacterized protein n=1 Tax=Oryza glumipatula TaxID=40148 RepID=A0A0E0BRP8_9ORYZ